MLDFLDHGSMFIMNNLFTLVVLGLLSAFVLRGYRLIVMSIKALNSKGEETSSEEVPTTPKGKARAKASKDAEKSLDQLETYRARLRATASDDDTKADSAHSIARMRLLKEIDELVEKEEKDQVKETAATFEAAAEDAPPEFPDHLDEAALAASVD